MYSQDYIIPSDNREQQHNVTLMSFMFYYIIPSDNREQQQLLSDINCPAIISYQAITGNNNSAALPRLVSAIISYQAITGNNNNGH